MNVLPSLPTQLELCDHASFGTASALGVDDHPALRQAFKLSCVCIYIEEIS